MLERHDLLVRPWAAAAKEQPLARIKVGDWVRMVLDAESERPLGFAVLNSRLPPFVAWLGGQTIRIHESDDASLLTTLRRPFGLWRRWRVRDAEEHAVGSFYGPVLFGQYGERFAELEEHVEGEVFQAASGVELGWVNPRQEGAVVLRFNKYAAERSPFVRMLLLAAVVGQALPV